MKTLARIALEIFVALAIVVAIVVTVRVFRCRYFVDTWGGQNYECRVVPW